MKRRGHLWMWLVGLGLIAGVWVLSSLLSEVGARVAMPDRVLYIVPTADVVPLPLVAQLPAPRQHFINLLEPLTGIDTPLYVAPIQNFVPGVVGVQVVNAVSPAYPTTPPLPALVPDRDFVGRVAFNGEGCAPRGVPAEGTLNQSYNSFHLGVDVGVQAGTPVRATHSGIVVFSDWSEIGYGYLVILQNSVFTTYYAHNSELYVLPGERVGRGSIIASSGSTGNSTGPHIHYEIRLNDVPVDPLTFDDADYVVC